MKNILKRKRENNNFQFAAVVLLLLFLLQGQLNQLYAADKTQATQKETVYPATPEGVVEVFCIEDFNGNYTWKRIQRYTTWLDGPGWDTVVVVKSFKIVGTKQQLRNAEVKVMYKTIGELVAHPWILHEKIEDKIAIFKLIKEGDKWKITEPQDCPHISVETAIKDLQGYPIGYYEKNKDEFKKEGERARIRVESAKKVVESLKKHSKNEK